MLIDNDAKLRVDLFKLLDRNDNPYYVGKLRYPGKLFLDKGVTFFAFTSEEEKEVLQIGPLDPKKQSIKQRSTTMPRLGGRIDIDLSPKLDKNEQVIYVGGARGLGVIDATPGIFFTLFISHSGDEKLQISRLLPEKVQDSSLVIDLFPLEDRDGNTYHVGKLQFPGLLEYDKGVLITISLDKNEESIEIAPMDRIHLHAKNKKGVCLNGKTHIPLERHGNKLIAAINSPDELNLLNGVFFAVFTSKEGEEELQISRLKRSHYQQKSSSDSAEHRINLPESDFEDFEDEDALGKIAM